MTVTTQQYASHHWSYYDFTLEASDRAHRCSECGTRVPAGERMYVSRRGGLAKKRVCSEQCGQAFDYREMIARSRRRSSR